MSAQAIAALVLAGVSAISAFVASRAFRRVSELRSHIRELEKQIAMKREWENVQAKNRKEAEQKIAEMHDGDAVSNAVDVLRKPNG